MSLVDLQLVIPNIRLDIRYATPLNFTGKAVYPYASAFLVEKAAKRLCLVQNALKKKGVGLKVYDSYRPLSIQKIFWDLVPDTNYVADPAKGSVHNRAAAVDVSLVTLNGQDLPMPTPYDEFSERAHRDFQECTSEERENRELLESCMVAEGFIPYPFEWWHFDDPDWQNYPILDIPFEEL